MSGNKDEKKERLSRVDQLLDEIGDDIEAFLDRNGYVSKEVRMIACFAIALWITQTGGTESVIQPTDRVGSLTT